MSVNFLVNKILRKYVDWDRHLNIGMLVVPRIIIELIPIGHNARWFQNLGRKVAREFAKHDFLPPYKGDLTVGSIVEAIRTASLYGGMFQVEVETHPELGRLDLALRHNQGVLWSHYFVGLLDEAFKVLMGKKVVITHTQNLVVAQIDTR